MALDFTIDTSGTQQDVLRRQRYAEALMKSGADYSPVQSPWQGVARLAQGLMGGWLSGQEARRERQGQAQASSDFRGLSGGGASMAPATPTAQPEASGGQMGQYSNAISGLESGGNYNALGPVTKSGDRAYGKYQIMGANIPQWTQAALGKPMSAQEFLANPQAQDAVFQHRFGQYVQKYGPEGAAKAWFAGEGGMNNPNARDQLGTTVSSYAKRFTAASLQGKQAPPVVASNDDDDDEDTTAPAKPMRLASAVPGAPATAAPLAAPAQPTPPAAQPAAQTAPRSAATQVAQNATQRGAPGTYNGVSQQQLEAAYRIQNNPYATTAQRQVSTAIIQQALTPKESYTQETDADGNLFNVNQLTHQKTLIKAAEKDPQSVQEYQFYKDNLPAGQQPMDYATWSVQKARAGAANVTTNVDTKGPDKYDTVIAEGIAKSHGALMNGVEDAQARARDVAAMQAAIDRIQKNNGSTGGMGQNEILGLKKSINAGANALGMENPFDEADISDKEFLSKFNRQMAGNMAKNSVGSRVTNFEMKNYLAANPGLEMSITGNQRLLGIQGQIEKRNVEVGQAMRDAATDALSAGEKVKPALLEKIKRDYDAQHHIFDPVTGQDLTQNYALPEFQNGGTNPSLSKEHGANIGKIRRYDPATGELK